MTSIAVGPGLIGKVARLRVGRTRHYRILVDDVTDLDEQGGTLIRGKLLYRAGNTSYAADDARGWTCTTKYRVGDMVEIEEG